MREVICLFLLLSLLPAISFSAEPVPVNLILDTDIGNDIDDALALAMIHALESRGEVRLLAVTITKDNEYAAPFVDLVNTFYGRPDIPIGVVRHGKTPEDAPMLHVPAEARDARGELLFPHRLRNGRQAPEAVALLVDLLRKQPDSSVTVAQIGFSTNLARLLQLPGGLELVRRKVKLLAGMGGNFAKPMREYNIYTDPEAAAYLLRQWPTPMVFSGFEVGLAVTFPYSVFSSGFRGVAVHPIAAAARSFFPRPEDRPAWDPTAVLYAIRPAEEYFQLSEPGRISLGEKDTTVFEPTPNGLCRYLILRPEKVPIVRQLLVDLVTEPSSAASRR